MAKFEPVLSRSKLILQVNTSLYPMRRTTSEMEPSFEAEVGADGQLDLSAPYRARLNVYIEHLKSNDQFIDRVVERRIDTQRFPLVKAELISLHERDFETYAAVGTIYFHGVTKQMEGTLQISQIDNKHFLIAGEIVVDVRDFNIEAPTMMALKADPIITITLNLVVKRPS